MPTPLQLSAARRALAAGGVIAYPTEAVWGLGCDPRNGAACVELLQLKRRPAHKGLILIAADFAQLAPYLADLPTTRLQPALDSWPGAATWLIPAAAHTPRWLTGAHATLAVRVTAHPVAAALCAAFGGAIVSTSANLAGRPPARSALAVRRAFGVRLGAIVPGKLGELCSPTPIRDLATGRLLRA